MFVYTKTLNLNRVVERGSAKEKTKQRYTKNSSYVHCIQK